MEKYIFGDYLRNLRDTTVTVKNGKIIAIAVVYYAPADLLSYNGVGGKAYSSVEEYINDVPTEERDVTPEQLRECELAVPGLPSDEGQSLDLDVAWSNWSNSKMKPIDDDRIFFLSDRSLPCQLWLNFHPKVRVVITPGQKPGEWNVIIPKGRGKFPAEWLEHKPYGVTFVTNWLTSIVVNDVMVISNLPDQIV